MKHESFYFTADDGAKIFVHHWQPDGEARAVIHIAHGLAEHAARYEPVAQALTDSGWHVYAHDQRGHGQTIQRADDTGHFGDEDGWNRLVSDYAQLIAADKSAHPALPLIAFGHSMGSLVVRQYIATHRREITAAVLSGSNGNVSPLVVVGKLVARLERMRLGKRGKSKLINSLSFDAFNKQFQPNRTEFDWLSRAEAEVDQYIADPRCGFICTTQSWIDFLDGITALSKPENLRAMRPDLPVYVFTGERDPVTENAKGSVKLVEDYRKAGLSDVTLKIYPEARHETLNELNRAAVTADLLAWLGRFC